MKNTFIKVFAPATIANVGPGFDVLGLAIAEPGDIVHAKRTETAELSFTLHQGQVPVPDNKNNVAAHVAQCMLDALQLPFGIQMTLYKNMPIGSGLGSSGASAAAAAFAVNCLLDKPMPKHELIHFAAMGEKLASGAAHADNVAPALLGGVCLIKSYSPLAVIQLPFKNIFYWVVAHPDLMIETKAARALLPKNISITHATEQSANLSALITALHLGDATLLAASLKDHIAEPVRATLIPGYNHIKQAALNAGAIGFSISGSGPSVFAITTSQQSAEKLANTLQQAFLTYAKVNCRTYYSLINTKGTHVLEGVE